MRRKFHRFLRRIAGMCYVEDFVRVYPDGLAFTSDGRLREVSSADRNNFLNHEKFYKFSAQFVSGKDVADVGCGSGYGCELMRRSGANSVNGTDLSRHSLEYARAKFGRSATFTLQGATRMRAYADDSFDVCVCSEVLEHLKEFGRERRAIEEIKRITKPGGLVIIGTPNSELLGDHGFDFEEMDGLLRSMFRRYTLIENALLPPGGGKFLWQKRLSEGRTGVIISENINLAETVSTSSDVFEAKRGLKPGILKSIGLEVDTSLLHNTHSWVALAINDK
jgi:2-polyprenyl-3-methyl-5-hydroxy-6-metoxy-1,4-benzoquinol methylase